MMVDIDEKNTALCRVSFILLAAHSLKREAQIAYKKRKYEGYISRLLCKCVIGLFLIN